MCLSYQTCLLKITYDPFELIDLSAIFDYPVAEADDQLKMITYCFRQNLGEKRLKALPFLLHTRGMRGYQDFLKDSDAWVARMKGSMAEAIDKVTGFVTNARIRCDPNNIATLQTQEGKKQEEDSLPSDIQEKEQQLRKPDCKLFVCLVHMFMFEDLTC